MAVRFYNTILQFSILFFTFALVWFSFIYYPKIVDQYKSGKILTRPLAAPVSASSKTFPIETDQYRLVAESSGTYYAFIGGKTLAEFVENKNGAQLALKNALSVESLCNLKIIYASSEGLSVPGEHTTTSNCR